LRLSHRSVDGNRLQDNQPVGFSAKREIHDVKGEGIDFVEDGSSLGVRFGEGFFTLKGGQRELVDGGIQTAFCRGDTRVAMEDAQAAFVGKPLALGPGKVRSSAGDVTAEFTVQASDALDGGEFVPREFHFPKLDFKLLDACLQGGWIECGNDIAFADESSFGLEGEDLFWKRRGRPRKRRPTVAVDDSGGRK
jgi:hypothetical protein